MSDTTDTSTVHYSCWMQFLRVFINARGRVGQRILASICAWMSAPVAEDLADPDDPDVINVVERRATELVAAGAELAETRTSLYRLAKDLGASEEYAIARPMEALRDRTLTLIGQHAQLLRLRDRLAAVVVAMGCDAWRSIPERADPVAMITDIVGDMERALARRSEAVKDTTPETPSGLRAATTPCLSTTPGVGPAEKPEAPEAIASALDAVVDSRVSSP